MSRRRVPSAPDGPTRSVRSRRPGQRRTPEDNVRVAAAWVLDQTLRSLAPAESFLDSALAQFDERDQGLLRELVLGTLRWLRRIDAIIAQASHRPFHRIEPDLRAPLRIAAYQLLFLDRIPAHAAVNAAVEQAHCLTHKGGASFVNAVLRRIARTPRVDDWPVKEEDPIRRIAIELSHPDFLVERWWRRFGEERTAALLRTNNRPKPLQLLAFRDRGGRELLAESLIDEGLEVEPSSLSPLGLTVRRGNPLKTQAFQEGRFYVQDEASQVTALIPPPQKGEEILDAAAAPGGKTFTLVGWDPELRPVMLDVSMPRLGLLRENLRRLRRRPPVVLADARQPPLRKAFHRVVLDLPCCGTGTLRKHPELKWRISPEEIGRLAGQAVDLLLGVADLVAPGGVLVAITCSLEEEENEGVVARFLGARPDFSPAPLEDALSPPLQEAIAGPGLWRLLPAGDHDGFTVQVLRRGGEGDA